MGTLVCSSIAGTGCTANNCNSAGYNYIFNIAFASRDAMASDNCNAYIGSAPAAPR